MKLEPCYDSRVDYELGQCSPIFKMCSMALGEKKQFKTLRLQLSVADLYVCVDWEEDRIIAVS